jgi:hypothetical protein
MNILKQYSWDLVSICLLLIISNIIGIILFPLVLVPKAQCRTSLFFGMINSEYYLICPVLSFKSQLLYLLRTKGAVELKYLFVVYVQSPICSHILNYLLLGKYYLSNFNHHYQYLITLLPTKAILFGTQSSHLQFNELNPGILISGVFSCCMAKSWMCWF